MKDHIARIRNFRTARHHTCYACGTPQHEARMRPFGRNVFDEPVTYVCDGCVDHAAHVNGQRAPELAAAQ